MNKKRVDGWILKAKEAIEVTKIAKDGEVNKSFRGQISSFGAALVMGSFKSAVSFFTEQGGASVERQKLIQAMYYIIFENLEDPKKILEYVCNNNTKELKEQFIDASIAIKLALNFFDLT
jgi:CRISPR-associated protein Cmr5